MDGIFIKGLQFPEGCSVCLFRIYTRSGEVYCKATLPRRIISKDLHVPENGYKPEWCPIVDGGELWKA